MLTKTSIGIILIKQGLLNSPPEVLLVHKRYTYAFNDFINGNYIYLHHNDSKMFLKKKNPILSLESLLEQMTTSELLDIMSLNFEQMWYRVCLDVKTDDPYYIKKYNKFHSEFIKFDNGKKLINLIKNTKIRGMLLWEVPKGRKNDSKETDLECAVREVEEETGITKEYYRIIPNIKKKISYVSNGIKYVFVYFIAIANIKLLRNRLGSKIYQTQKLSRDIREVSEIGWFNLQYLKLLDNGTGYLENLIKPCFNLVKKYLKTH
jgi:8-oxo-dGTP pyrophosphatase MutT (NUDIX family)